ncbi:hypothetical protein RM572_21790 [Streptomyces sp. DSM 42041]|uniref:Uncharacterized protein n=1 Tax=Streptomyces hazeniae TaxID=3075538 RepID=A0ABU2NXD7_9ACTN|nr:hypothetical protein [Streptomyces sp. DSM 42041]MDT0381394.1 hypothetical protein [Streptomyces sp. DSM 42041]
MSAFSLGVEIACDGPDEARDCPQSAAVPRRFGSMTAPEVRADGRSLGWTLRRRDGQRIDLCPDCRKEARR